MAESNHELALKLLQSGATPESLGFVLQSVFVEGILLARKQFESDLNNISNGTDAEMIRSLRLQQGRISMLDDLLAQMKHLLNEIGAEQ